MNETEQIEEMAKVIQKGELDRNRGDLDCTEFPTDIVVKVGLQRLAGAKALYRAGYHKVERGEWDGMGYSRSCSKCGARRDIKVQVYWSFCPNCGADMRGEKGG